MSESTKSSVLYVAGLAALVAIITFVAAANSQKTQPEKQHSLPGCDRCEMLLEIITEDRGSATRKEIVAAINQIEVRLRKVESGGDDLKVTPNAPKPE